MRETAKEGIVKKILIADDTSLNISMVTVILRSRYEILAAEDGLSCLESVRKNMPDLILLDVMMPGMDGYEVCRTLKADEATSHIPVIFITSKTEMGDVVKGFESGAVDYITKPFNSHELIARVDTHVALVSALNDLKTYNESLELITQQLLEKTKELDALARTDFLTGLANRLHILEHMKIEEARILRKTALCSVIIADIDHFKKINDIYGHEAGDIVLKTLAELFKKNTRKQDIVARWGGEEFLFFLPETPGTAAGLMAEKIRTAVDNTIIACPGGEIHATMTFGVAEFSVPLSIEGTIKLADDALYEGKKNGRNRVEAALIYKASDV